ncbi:MAG: 6-pyruvoyl tetrahydropterin synthase family protein [Candidatus Kapaibacterium sp.]|jgi:6-pyruvoyltetrahydropterin/6-carboxytetrahydropterin synthase
MLTRIAKDFRWEMAHRLPFHEAGCKNVHGHSYRMLVELAGEPMSNGMVLDYFVLKQYIDPLVAEIDHAFLCDETDSLMKDFLKQSGLKVVFVEFPTTAENIARWFYDRLADIFSPMKHISELRIRVEETERTYAEVAGEIRYNLSERKSFEHQAHMLE